ncbi:MAG: 6-phosphogluconolactonase [Gammaproteobacteria bacterium]|nr:6-phosphogluconolactonase [Gammaproteobacteria bacterium]
MNSQYKWKIFNDADAVATAACEAILTAANDAISQRGRFKIVLAGGSTPEKIYRLLARADADWQHWWIYHGDERCLPVDHQDRNSLMAAETWLDHIPIPKTQLFDIPAELGPEQGASLYADIINNTLPFDLVLLGMGEDGHTASLFPGHSHNPDNLTHAVHNSPKPPPERVSLSAKSLSASNQVVFLITGANKRDAVARWRVGADLPVASIHAPQTTVFIDRAALPE